jgi:hypothetical protein
MKKAITSLLLLFLFEPSIAFAENQQMQVGLNWLISAKLGNEYWGCKIPAGIEIDELTDEDIVPTYFRDTCEATDTLYLLKQRGTDYNAAINWLFDSKPNTTEKIARKIEVLSKTSFPYSDDLTLLLSYQNPDGGFGGYKKLRSNIVDSIRALRALNSAKYSDKTVIEKIILYIRDNQNPDGGWGFKGGAESKISYTALVLSTLSQFKTTYDLRTQINNAASYLLAHQNPDGSFGGGTVFETALAFISLIESGQGSALPLQNAINYISSTQLPNGSWNDDPYSTALALRALAMVKPNLSLSSSDITFSNPAPTVGETITITANIKNTGPAHVDPSTGSGQVLVQFYDGDPSAGGILIGETTMLSVPSYSNSQTSITWTIPSASSKIIFIVADPHNTIDELNEINNRIFFTKKLIIV